MSQEAFDKLWKMIGLRYTSHPWHGIPIGKEAPEVVTTFIEVIPSDTVKYEVDKVTGYLKIDRPQKFSNIVPTLYGFIPQTYCKEEVAAYCREKTGREHIVGLGLYNVMGQPARADSWYDLNAGEHTLGLEVAALPSGGYFVWLQVEGKIAVVRMVKD